MIRAPICTVVGHVDHGKTTLLDTIRGTALASAEAGKITQAIGASIIPAESILEKAGKMLGDQQLTVPALLFIDTPGHAAFTGMRKRGGGLADIAVLIVDLNEGFKPQTKEAVEILKNYKTPFVVAANKVDRAPGYKEKADNVIEDINAQDAKTIEHIETKTYQIASSLEELGFKSDRFDRLESFDKQIAIIPTSALTGKGVDILLALIVGLAQKYLEDNLGTDIEGPAKGTVLEVNEEKGLGTTLNAILYDGNLQVGDDIVIGGLDAPIITKVRALLQPAQASDMRDKKTKYQNIERANAATGVKIVAPGMDEVTAGMPFLGGEVEQAKNALEQHADSVTIETDQDGVIVKADNIGSLEAVIQLLREKNIPIQYANVGAVSKKDIARAASNEDKYKAILAFNVQTPSEAEVKIIQADIIYKLIDDYQLYVNEVQDKVKKEMLAKIKKPAKLRILEECIFRASNPLVCGVEIVDGSVRRGSRIIKEENPSKTLGVVKDIQDKNESIEEATKGMQVAISVPGAQAGRHVEEGDELWAAIEEEDFIELKKYGGQLRKDEIALLKEFADIMREKNPAWGI